MKETSRLLPFLPDLSSFFPFFLIIFPIFPDFFPIFGKFFAVRGGTLPPLATPVAMPLYSYNDATFILKLGHLSLYMHDPVITEKVPAMTR